MGSACCVAARDRTIVSGSGSEALHRNIRYSPTWSFRWDNRGRVAGEETSVRWVSDGISRNGGSDTKCESAYVSEDGSPFESLHRHTWQKSPFSEGTAMHTRTPGSDKSISRNVSTDVSLEQVKESEESPAVSCPSPLKLSLSLPSTSSFSTPALLPQSQLHPSGESRWPNYSPGHLPSGHVSDKRIQGFKSPNNLSVSEEKAVIPSRSNESNGGSHGGSSDGWSMRAFSELMATSHGERWFFDNESVGFNRDEISRSSSRILSSPSVDLQTCGICSKLLTEKSSWSSQKIIATNDLSVVAVLICGHVYHAECLENMTPEIDKYDPACPVCTLGEKQTHKLSQQALKAEIDMKAKQSKRSRKIMDSDLQSGSTAFDHVKSAGHEGDGPKMASSSSMRSSLGKPFLRRHFSFGSKGSKSLSGSHSTQKKGFFWAKSSKM
ncbi:hypothetical protein HS088_TW02G00098 [Tripterygium wilfordii]|uniref:RING-type domain-containing protein n=1 Tax=Tripterygium wilfordii TaxID=458696 RepID=A0A7J7DXH5_TRIWF|nr:uncharacterized protein LOC120014798 [Tripterygium wilfordii]XP_038722805.1 uncharacterized protein LOC120014798 [Tripterygium wilfordii]XP_038722813.1 uncharacterized protein LOC120014798 [Tripterygium wilfordii]KAF5751088.1 hypothetical protein HS088_TW02G00098 [Tripterygium wilfordii]